MRGRKSGATLHTAGGAAAADKVKRWTLRQRNKAGVDARPFTPLLP